MKGVFLQKAKISITYVSGYLFGIVPGHQLRHSQPRLNSLKYLMYISGASDIDDPDM